MIQEGLGQVVTLDFAGTWIRTSVIRGTVTAENDGVGGVTLTVSGMGHFETVTGAEGAYEFANLRAGTYTLEISGFDTEDVEFGPVSTTTTVGVHETRIVNFEGTYVRTSGIRGQVTVDEFPLEETATADFAGILLRTAAISGVVTVSGDGLGGVHVTVYGEDEEYVVATNATGYYSVDHLHAGDYSVTISGYGTEYSFDATSKSVSVGLRETATVSFEGQEP